MEPGLKYFPTSHLSISHKAPQLLVKTLCKVGNTGRRKSFFFKDIDHSVPCILGYFRRQFRVDGLQKPVLGNSLILIELHLSDVSHQLPGTALLNLGDCNLMSRLIRPSSQTYEEGEDDDVDEDFFEELLVQGRKSHFNYLRGLVRKAVVRFLTEGWWEDIT